MTIRRIETNPAHSFESPEGGCFWHALSAEGRELFEKQSDEFGQVTTETTGSGLAGQRCIRCRPDREGVTPWLEKNGAVVAIPKECLEDNEWGVYGSAGDAHVLASAVLRCGEMHP